MDREPQADVTPDATVRDFGLIDERTQARVVRTTLWTFIVLAVAVVGIGVAASNTRSVLLAGVGGAASLVLLLALPRLGTRRVGPACVGSLFLLTTLATATGRGVHDVSMVLYPSALLMATLLLRSGHLLPFTLGTVTTVIGVGVARRLGAAGLPPAALADVAVAALLLLVAGVLTRLSVGRLQAMVAERRRAEAAVLESKRELEARNEALVLVNELAHRLHRGLDLEGIAAETVDVMIRHSQPPMVAFYLLEEDGRRLRMIADHGFTDEERALGEVLQVDSSLSGIAVRERRLVRSDDLGGDARADEGVRQALAARSIMTALSVPLSFGDHVFGTVNLLYGPRRDFSPVDLDTFQAIGQQVALAISNVRRLAGLEHQAFHDSLTGLPNRASLHRRVAGLLACGRTVEHIGIILLDLSRFREFNEALGHRAADRLLVEIGVRLRDHVEGEGAELFRLGGDEFVVLAPGLDADAAEAVAHRVLADLRRPFDAAGLALEVSASLGVAAYPVHGADSHELLRCADVAMYRAKETGTHVTRYGRELDHSTPERLAFLGELGAAVRDARMVLHYQPVVALATGEIVGFEALVRWPHPSRGLVLPAEFIPLAEASDLIHPLTYWVVEAALTQLRCWQAGRPDLTMAVNLSARNLLDGNCGERLEDIIHRLGVDPSRLELELTETAVMTDAETALRVLDRIMATGARLAIDDFGTGYSSLGFLTRFPVHALKIDRSFVSGLANGGQSRAIIASTIGLARGLDLTVAAEGVEDGRTADILRGMGCDLAQGFHFAAPVTADVAERLLADGGRLHHAT